VVERVGEPLVEALKCKGSNGQSGRKGKRELVGDTLVISRARLVNVVGR
jgi:hypothetical protein